MPGVYSVSDEEMRLEWQLNALQAIESLRMHAAEDGQAACIAGRSNRRSRDRAIRSRMKPFAYRLDGETAILELPFSDGMRAMPGGLKSRSRKRRSGYPN